MEPAPSTNVKIPLDRNRDHYISSLIEGSAASSAVGSMTATAISLPSTNNQLVLYTERPQFSSTTSVGSAASQPSHTASTSSSSSASSAPIEKLSRPMAFDKVKDKHFIHFHSKENMKVDHVFLSHCCQMPRGIWTAHMCLYHRLYHTRCCFLFHKNTIITSRSYMRDYVHAMIWIEWKL